MLITVLTATYKNFSRLENTVKSVLGQLYDEIEYIITDDGSQNFDEMMIRNIVNKYKRDNLKNFILIHHKKNIGTVKNLNYAYRKSSGELIIPVSSDDELYSKDVIKQIVNRYQKLPFNLLVTSRLICDENDNELYFLPHMTERRKLNKMNQGQQYDRFIGKRFCDVATGSCLVVNRAYFHKVGGFDERYRLYEDAPFFARYLENSRLETEFSIIGLRYHLGGISTNGEINSLLRNDMDTYLMTDRIKHIKNLSTLSRRIVLYDYFCVKNRGVSKCKLNKIRLKFLDVIVYTKLVFYLRKIAAQYDKIMK